MWTCYLILFNYLESLLQGFVSVFTEFLMLL